MLEHSIYSVISPEGCASILWRSADEAKAAAEALRLTAEDLKQLGVIDSTVPEPVGGAHRDIPGMIDVLGNVLEAALRELLAVEGGTLKARRRERFLDMGRTAVA